MKCQTTLVQDNLNAAINMNISEIEVLAFMSVALQGETGDNRAKHECVIRRASVQFGLQAASAHPW